MSGRVISTVKCATDTETRDISVEVVLEAIRSGGKKLRGQMSRYEIGLNRSSILLATCKRQNALSIN